MIIWQSKRAAGGAHLISAEVPVDGCALELFRQAGFTVYSRQTLFVLETGPETDPPPYVPKLVVRPLRAADYPRLNALYSSTVPRLVRQADLAPQVGWSGLALIYEDRLRGYVSVWEGKHGTLLQPHLHLELYDLVPQIFRHVLAQLPRRPTYVRLLAYQEWLRRTLELDLGFVEGTRHALVARHTTVLVKSPAFSPLAALESIGLSPVGVEVALETSLEGLGPNLTQWDIESPTTSKN
ncbi:MAG: hypothetical protein HC915_03865 [Anaerolineae bacterium]|nr:hypothetical protein [Anaerolineae bacterium]